MPDTVRQVNCCETCCEGKENLRSLVDMRLWEGAQDIVLDRA